MRAGVGTEVTVWDGGGAEFTARVLQIGRSDVQLEVLARHQIDRESPRRITLGVALPKGDRQRWLVEKAVELGVARLVPLVANRGVARPGDQALTRMRGAVIEASNQCGRNRLMEVAGPLDLADYVCGVPTSACRLLAHPLTGSKDTITGLPSDIPTGRAVYLAVGPEGGFTREEVDQATINGWQQVDLGPRILRVETAAIAMAAMIGLR